MPSRWRRRSRRSRSGSASGSSTRPRSTRRTAPAPGSARGIGLDEALPIFAEIRATLGLPVLTDVHEHEQCARAAEAVDVLQIPAFLCRQTDLLVAAAQHRQGRQRQEGPVPRPLGHDERRRQDHRRRQSRMCSSPSAARRSATTRSSPTCARCRSWRRTGAPVIFDATHSVQQPGGQGGSSGGEREFVPVLARAAVAVGVAGVFIETHQDPDSAPSDGPNMVPLRDMEELAAPAHGVRPPRQGRREGRRPMNVAGAGGAALRCGGCSPSPPLPNFTSSLFMRAIDPLVPQVAIDLSTDPATVALLTTAFALPYALLQPVLGAARRHGRQDAADDDLRRAPRGERLRRRGGAQFRLPVRDQACDRRWRPAAFSRSRSRLPAISCRCSSARSR